MRETMTTADWVTGAVAALALVGAIGTAAWGDEGRGCMGGMMKAERDADSHAEHQVKASLDSAPAQYLHHLLMHGKEIGLTPEQVAKLKALQLDFEKARARAEAEVRVARLDLAALLEDGKAEPSAVEAAAKAVKAHDLDLLTAALRARQAAGGLLTPDQRVWDQELRESMRHERHSGAGDHGGSMEPMGPGRHGAGEKTPAARAGTKDPHQH